MKAPALATLACVTLAASPGVASDQRAWLEMHRVGADPADLSPADLVLPAARRAELAEAEVPFTDLLWRIETRLASDGLVHWQVLHVRHFLSEQGAEAGGELEFTLQPSHEKGRIEAAYVRTREDRRVDVAPETVQVRDYVRPRVFSDIRRIVVPMPGLSAGATAVLAYEGTFRSDRWPLPWASLFLLQLATPVENLEIDLQWDADVASPVWGNDDPDLDCIVQPTRLRCKKRLGAPFAMDPDLAVLLDQIPQLVVGRPISWNALASRVRDVVYEQLHDGVPQPLVDRLVAGARTPQARWNALFRFVASEIRYLGLEQHITAVVPRPPRVTLDRRYGDCKDKVALLLALAEAAGLDAYPALVSSGRTDASKLLQPAASYFDHMIACLDVDGGDPICADVTVDAASPAESILPISGNVVLDLRSGTSAPRRLPTVEHAWEIEIEGDTTLDCDGRIEGRLERRFSGMAALAYRAGFENATPTERNRMLREEFRQAAGSQPLHVGMSALEDASQPLVATARYDIAGNASLSSSKSYAEQPLWLRYHGLMLRSDNRSHTFRNPGLRIVSTLRYTLCPDLRARFLGPELDLHSSFGAMSRRYTTDESRVEVRTELSVPSGDIAAQMIPHFNHFLEASVDQTPVWFSLDPVR